MEKGEKREEGREERGEGGREGVREREWWWIRGEEEKDKEGRWLAEIRMRNYNSLCSYTYFD